MEKNADCHVKANLRSHEVPRLLLSLVRLQLRQPRQVDDRRSQVLLHLYQLLLLQRAVLHLHRFDLGHGALLAKAGYRLKGCMWRGL